MYIISNELKETQKSSLREVNAYITVNNDTIYDNNEIINFSITDDLLSGDNFTIGTVISKTLELNLSVNNGAIKSDDLIKLFIKMKTANGWEEVPMGSYYVTNCSYKDRVLSLTAMDKFAFIDTEYESKLTYPTKLEEILKEVCSFCGIEKCVTSEDIIIENKMTGYSCREIISICASFGGYSAKINRLGQLDFVIPSEVVDYINGETYYSFSKGEDYKASGVACYFGDVPIIMGDNTNSLIPYNNQYVTSDNIDIAYNKLKGLSYSTSEEFTYRGYINIDAGDFVELMDIEGKIHKLLVTSHKLTFDGGLNGSIVSIGETKSDNAITQTKYKNKKSLTELNIKLGEIQAKVEEIDIDSIYDELDGGSRNYIQKSDKFIQIEEAEQSDVLLDEFYINKDELNSLKNEYMTLSVLISLDKCTSNNNGGVGAFIELEYDDDVIITHSAYEEFGTVSDSKSYYGRIKNTFTLDNNEILSAKVYLKVIGLNGGNLSIGRPQLESGRLMSSWNLAIEDIEDSIDKVYQEITTNYQTAITQTKDSITTMVSETYTTKTETQEIVESTSSKIEQTKKDLTVSFTKETNGIRDDLQDYKDSVSTYIRFDENGIELGKSDSAFKTQLTNEELAFIQDNSKVAYINNKKMYITEAEILDTLRIGKYAYIPRANGNTSFRWME